MYPFPILLTLSLTNSTHCPHSVSSFSFLSFFSDYITSDVVPFCVVLFALTLVKARDPSVGFLSQILAFSTSPSFPSTTHKGMRDSSSMAFFPCHGFKQDSHSLTMKAFPIQAAAVKVKNRFDTVRIV